MRILPRSFYNRDTLVVARELLGMYLVRELPTGERMVGKIVETEAYKGFQDPASHAYRGKTPRNAVMFGPPGRAYVYFIYGKNYCLNIVTEPEGVPAAVLIRALEPINGVNVMMRYRKVRRLVDLTNGPGKLTEAMNITRELNGVDMTRRGPLYVVKPERKESFEIGRSGRIGVRAAKDWPWRFFIKGNPYVSKKV
ncbi:MAG: DNA-3-methyladenine glycosylase [Candidatus Baldrarchaeia archaeon]